MVQEVEGILFDYITRYITLTQEEKQSIIDLNIFRTYRKGAILLKEGKVSNDSYFVIKGCIRCYYIIDGEEKTTAFYSESETFAPLCSIIKKPSEYNVACIEDSIIAVSKPDMEKVIFEKFPRFESLCRILSEELLASNQSSFDDFKTSTPEQRYLHLLKTKPELVRRVPQHQLASYLGMQPQSLSRIRRRLMNENKIDNKL